MKKFTVSIISNDQITIPASMHRLLGLTKGTKIDVFPLDRERFIAHVRHPSRILAFASTLRKHLDQQLPRTGKEVAEV